MRMYERVQRTCEGWYMYGWMKKSRKKLQRWQKKEVKREKRHIKTGRCIVVGVPLLWFFFHGVKLGSTDTQTSPFLLVESQASVRR